MPTIDPKVRLAETYVWWQVPEITLRDPRKLLCQILRYGRAEDYITAVELWGTEALRTALLTARRGEIDAKSAHFWRLHFGVAESTERTLPADMKDVLTRAASEYDARTRPLPKLSARLDR